MTALLEIHELTKTFSSANGESRQVVRIPAFRVEPREQIGIHGQSGSGKTTFLNLIAGILRPTSGTILFDGQSLGALGESARDRLRGSSMGYIFQTFNLLQGYTCLENVLLGMSFGPGPDVARAVDLLERVGLSRHLRHYPRQLSSGQQQRVAVARALANRPKLVLADEPTGNLDPSNAGQSVDLIKQVCQETGAALLLVTHDRPMLGRFERTFDFAELNRAEPTLAEKAQP